MKKDISIKKRITLYYSIAMILVVIAASLLLLISFEKQVNITTKDTLITTVQNAFDDIDYENQIIEIDNDFDSYQKSVILLVYTEKGELIKGSIPKNFPAQTPLSTGDYQELESDEHTWIFYDLYQQYDNGQGLWVRGIYALDDAIAVLSSLRHILIFFIPLLLIIIIYAGHKIIKHAFDPVVEITEAANSINYGHDLSKRLPLGENHDEFYELTETLNHMIQRLDDAFKAEKQFSSDVSHELKTPLAVIMSECEYILLEERSTEEYKESLETIEKQTQRTLSMIHQLLQISRSINKETTIEKELFNLSILAESIVFETTLLAEEKNIKIKSTIEPDIEITADETLILRVIMNLMNNAVKYSKESFENSFVHLEIFKKSDSQVSIIVSDNGIGIAEEHYDKIFNKFYKVDKSRNRQGESFGLGLAMVKWIVEAHGGYIKVDSRINEGSTFSVVLPLS